MEIGRFKEKDSWCPNCQRSYVSHEEKESDVALASKLFEVCQTDEAETIILMTGDTDLAPAVRACRRLFPTKMVFFAFPYKRTNTELKGIAPESFSIKRRSYIRHQLPDPLILEDGSTIAKPATW